MGYAGTAGFVPIAGVMVTQLGRWLAQVGLKNGRRDWLWALGLGLAALPLFWINLGGPTLRDWDEATVAQVAREIAQAGIGPGFASGAGSSFWQALLHPTLWGVAYVNKPPLMHGLIALLFRGFGVHEWTARLPSASLSALGVPLLYGILRQLQPLRRTALLGAIAYLTLLPIVRHGRLAMLDGAIVCFYLLTVWAGLRSRRDGRWSLGIGLGVGLMCLTKGVLGLLLGGLVLVFLAWDTPRLLASGYLWAGLLLGLGPAIAWYANQALAGAEDFVQRGLVDQALKRLWEPVEDHRGSIFYYFSELLEWGWPWVMFLPWGLEQAWRERGWSWGKLVLVLGGGYFAVISSAQTKLPWYIMPLYPVVAIAIAPVLTNAWDRLGGTGMEPYTPERSPRIWLGLLGLLTLVAVVGCAYFSGVLGFLGTFLGLTGPGGGADRWIAIALGLVAAGMALSAGLLGRGDAQWILVLAWSWYLGLLVLMASPSWVFELGEAEAVQPMAAVIRARPQPGLPVYTMNPIERPSLSFYSETRVIPLCGLPPAFYPTEPFYLWLQAQDQAALNLAQPGSGPDLGGPDLGAAEGWQLQGPLQLTQPTLEDGLRSRLVQRCDPPRELP